MRFNNYLNEIDLEERRPETDKFDFMIDNPGGDWLEGQRENAKGTKAGGALTAKFGDNFLLPTDFVTGTPGKQGEDRSLDDERVQKLMEDIKQNGIKRPIFINVNHNGKAYINEGNRRLLIAETLGIKYIPVEIAYFAGGELIVNSKWYPDKIVEIAEKWK